MLAWVVFSSLVLSDLDIKVEAGADEDMDGGYRGKIHLVPQLPMASYRKHLDVGRPPRCTTSTRSSRRSSCRIRRRIAGAALALKFVRSVGKRTPSAYATGWTITYNVEGSLLTSAAGVRETLFHELFHLNDDAARRLVGEDARKPTTTRSSRSAARRSKCLDAVRAERHEGPRDRDVLRVPAEQRRRGPRVRRRARGPLLEGADARSSGRGKLSQPRVQVRTRRKMHARGRRSSTNSSPVTTTFRPADLVFSVHADARSRPVRAQRTVCASKYAKFAHSMRADTSRHIVCTSRARCSRRVNMPIKARSRFRIERSRVSAMTESIAGPDFERRSHCPATVCSMSEETDGAAPCSRYGRDILVVDDNDTNLIAIEAALAAARPQARARALRRRGARPSARAGLRADHPRRRDARHGRLRDGAARSLARPQPRDADHLHHRPVLAGRRRSSRATSSARSTS